MPLQVAQGQNFAAPPFLQQDGGAPAALHQGGQKATIAAQRWLFAVLSAVEPQGAGALAAQAAAADGQQQASQHQRFGGQGPQSSKRELLSRGAPPAAGRTGRNSASLTPASASGFAAVA